MLLAVFFNYQSLGEMMDQLALNPLIISTNNPPELLAKMLVRKAEKQLKGQRFS